MTYIPWHGKKRQIDAYNQACKKYEKKYKYIMFFDADEFLIADDLLKGKSLYQILDSVFKRQKKTACLGINSVSYTHLFGKNFGQISKLT